jgi:excisionase family DNA binding protein
VWVDSQGRLWARDAEQGIYRIDVPRWMYRAFLEHHRPRPHAVRVRKRASVAARPDPMSHHLGGVAPPPVDGVLPPLPPPPWLTIQDAARLLSCCPSTIKRLLANSRFPSCRIPGTRLRRIHRADMCALMGGRW